MGTRAQFFIGNPQDVESRQWLGCVAWDGFPDEFKPLAECKTTEEFRAAVTRLVETRDDFCNPATHGFPFPWVKDLFLTDYTYAFFDGRVQLTAYHRGWIDMIKFLNFSKDEHEDYGNGTDELPRDTPSPSEVWDRGAPDSIMVISAA